MQAKIKMPPKQCADSDSEVYLMGYRRALPRALLSPQNDNYDIEMTSENVGMFGMQFRMEVIIVKTFAQQLLEKDAIINDQAARLSEFERKRNFAPSGLNLPNDYYDNDIYLVE